METKTARNLRELAQEALDVQDACNLCGVAQDFAKAMLDLGHHCPQGTKQRNTHPITKLWVDKLLSLAGLAHMDTYADVQELTGCNVLSQTVCAICGEESGSTGSMSGLVHRWGPRDHAFEAAK